MADTSRRPITSGVGAIARPSAPSCATSARGSSRHRAWHGLDPPASTRWWSTPASAARSPSSPHSSVPP
eukprot:4588774-Prymnesium_polylepis.1